MRTYKDDFQEKINNYVTNGNIDISLRNNRLFQKKENIIFKKNGQILELNNQGIAVKTIDGLIYIKSLQLEGSKIMDASSFVHGRPAFINSNLN